MIVNIITLVENSAGIPYVLGEWGQSILIEADGKRILFDTGPSRTVVENARRLNIDLSTLDSIVISHAHYDHTGGLKDVLSLIQKSGARPGGIKVIAHPDVFQPKYFYVKGAQAANIGIPFKRDELEGMGAKFTLTKEPVQISPNVLTTGEVEISVDYEQIEPSLHIKEGEGYMPDPLADDLGIIIKSEKGLIVLLGCAHRGMINTILHAQKLTGIKDIYAVIGGTHLLMAGEERLYKTIEALKAFGITKLGPSHCTGPRQSAVLATEFGDSFFFNNAGTRTIL